MTCASGCLTLSLFCNTVVFVVTLVFLVLVYSPVHLSEIARFVPVAYCVPKRTLHLVAGITPLFSSQTSKPTDAEEALNILEACQTHCDCRVIISQHRWL